MRSSAQFPGGLSPSKLEDMDLASPVASRCDAAATPQKRCVKSLPISTSAPAVETSNAVDCCSSSFEILPGRTDKVQLLTKSPVVSVAKKIASVNYIRSATSPQTDLFTVLSRAIESGSNHPTKPDQNSSATGNTSYSKVPSQLSSKKVEYRFIFICFLTHCVWVL